jgi:magnesium transporter
MLAFHNTMINREVVVALDATALPVEANWIDAFLPDPTEIAFLERILGIEVPSLQRMSEIETSSRLSTVGSHLFLTIPMVYHDAIALTQTTPLGFVLARDNVLTIRFKPIRACDRRAGANATGDHPLPGGSGAFVAVLDSIVDYLADELENLTTELDNLSHTVFRHEDRQRRRDARGDSRDLRLVLRDVGRAGATTSRMSETLLGISRMVPYVASNAADFLGADARARLESINRDVSSLNDYEKHQSDKIQFLLDATLGMINVDQNNIFKILTLVSVVGIPPTLIASMYGMNFKNMPELDWTYGYPYALVLIALSAIAPLAWFKWRGWW